MDGLDDIIANFSNLASDINSSYLPIPMDTSLNILSPIDEINMNLKYLRNFLCLAHINAVSVPLHRDEIARILIKAQIDFLAISETNIKKNTPRDLYKFNGYKLFHTDRDWGNSGGVGLLIKNEYSQNAKKISVNYNQPQPEHLFIEIEINKIKILVGVLYKSPSVRYGVFNEIFEAIAFLTTKYDHCVLLGDFNIDQLKTDSPAFKFFQNNILTPLSLTQIVKSPTRITVDSCTLIDLIIVNSPNNVKFVGTTDCAGISDHKLVYCSYSFKKPKFKPQVLKRRDFRKFVKDDFIRDFSNVQWSTVEGLADINLNDATSKFENIYTKIINSHAPMREIKITKPVDASWLSDEITFLMDLRDKYKNKWNEIKKNNFLLNFPISSSDTFYYSRFKELKNQVNHLIRKAKYSEFNRKINQKISDSKKFHFNLKEANIVNSKKNQSGSCHLDPNKLNNSFAKNNNAHVCDKHIKKMIKKINRRNRSATFEFQQVSIDDIIKTTNSLKSNACGIDEISAFFIKLSIKSSAKVFAEIVNPSLKSGLFPSRWKKARIKPIPKISDPIYATDFRPISLLPAFSKIIEKIMAKQMKIYLINNNLLDKFQSAYREQHSTITALIDITDNIYKSLDNSEITILVLLDYSKAFDCANHKLILAKLKALGFKDSSLKWIASYLADRSQQVVTDKGESNWINLLNGVPQGSILGPLLFTILVSDIAKGLKFCKYHLYADDTQLYISGKVDDIINLITKINEDLNYISNFSFDNCLKLNEGKSVFIILGSRQNISTISNLNLPPVLINNLPIKRESKVKNLGILFEENLSWDAEINKCISSGYYKLKQAYRFKNFLSNHSKKLIVQSYILSQFNYSSIILQNMTKHQIDKIQKFQNTCARFILNLKKYDHISEGLVSLGFLKMAKIRDLQALTLMHKIRSGKAPQYLKDKVSLQGDHHAHLTRNRSNICTRRFKTNFGRNCFLNSIGNKYNEITNRLHILPSTSVNSFKNNIKKHFMEA